jgi:membrane protein
MAPPSQELEPPINPGGSIGMMTWMWISMIVVLLGAELNAEIQRKTNPASSTS